MYGSDWPLCKTNQPDPKEYADVVLFLEKQLKGLPKSDLKAIFQDSAIEFYGLQDVVVQQPQVVLLAPHGAVLGLRDTGLTGVDQLAAGEENTNLPGGKSPTVVVSEELAVCSQTSPLQIRGSHKD